MAALIHSRGKSPSVVLGLNLFKPFGERIPFENESGVRIRNRDGINRLARSIL